MRHIELTFEVALHHTRLLQETLRYFNLYSLQEVPFKIDDRSITSVEVDPATILAHSVSGRRERVGEILGEI